MIEIDDTPSIAVKNNEQTGAPPVALPDEPLYYIQDGRSTVGNSAMWWRVDGHGYTCNLNEAWKVPAQKALRICKDRPTIDIPRLASDVDRLAQRHFDVQFLKQVRGMAL